MYESRPPGADCNLAASCTPFATREYLPECLQNNKIKARGWLGGICNPALKELQDLKS